MASYLLIASREPHESGEVHDLFQLAKGLAESHEQVTLLLLQNGVLPARAGAADEWLGDLARAGVEVIADELSLRERGVSRERLRPEVRPVSLDAAVEHLAAGSKALWV
jgi:sulfur relay (sulfurtransferase) complex TusBCD TusD component (DsrE family)